MLLLQSLCLATAVIACPGLVVRQYQAPGPDDLRSPCPIMNTLANHNYLPHDGRNITLQQYIDVMAVLNFEPAFAGPAHKYSETTGKTVFNLDELNNPDIIQHISSLTRDDFSHENTNLKPDPARIARLFADSDTEFVTVDSIARTRLRDDGISKPETLSEASNVQALQEAALIMMVMMDKIPSADSNPDPSVFKASKDRLQILLNEERFPTELGWRPSSRQVKLTDLEPAYKAINASMISQSRHGYELSV